MPNDRLTGTKRWRYAYTHNQHWSPNSLGTFGLALDMRRVSDNTYWRDFQDINGYQGDRSISERLLPSTGTLNWSYGNWSAYLREQRWQTLQLPAPDNITPPFDLSPQLHLRYARDNVAGFDLALDLDRTRFRSDPKLTGYPNGTRSYAHARISYPWLRPWGFAIPTLEWHATHYQTDTPMPNGARSASRVLPTFALDGGLVFERDTQLFGRAVSQTLEPRLFYAYTPLRRQDHLPVYDSALKDFNLVSIFSSNPFTGSDRISNNNTLTAGFTSRMYDTQTGSELARLSLAQRHRFTPRQVFLNAADQPGKRASAIFWARPASTGAAAGACRLRLPTTSAPTPFPAAASACATRPGASASFRPTSRARTMATNKSTRAGSGPSTICGATRAKGLTSAKARARAAGTRLAGYIIRSLTAV